MNRDRIATGFNSFIEKHYDYGVIGNKNTYALDLDLVINKEEFNNPIQSKVIYSHPSQLPLSHGTVSNVTYSGTGSQNYRKRHVEDGAYLQVSEEPPILESQNIDFGDVKTILLGDRKDKFLEGKGITIQAIPDKLT